MNDLWVLLVGSGGIGVAFALMYRQQIKLNQKNKELQQEADRESAITTKIINVIKSKDQIDESIARLDREQLLDELRKLGALRGSGSRMPVDSSRYGERIRHDGDPARNPYPMESEKGDLQ